MQDDRTSPEQQEQAKGAARPDEASPDWDAPALVSTAISAGEPMDDAGSPTSAQGQETHAPGPQDRRYALP